MDNGEVFGKGSSGSCAPLLLLLRSRRERGCAWVIRRNPGRVDLGGCPPRSPTDPGLH